MFHNYFTCFSIFGVAPKNLSIHSGWSFLNIGPFALHALCLIVHICVIYRDEYFSNTSTWYYFGRITAILPNAVCILDILMGARDIDDILLRLNGVNTYFKRFIRVTVNLKRLKCSIKIKCVFCVLFVVLPHFLKIFFISPVLSTTFTVFAAILIVYRTSAIFILIILLEYTNFLMFSLNKHLTEVSDLLQLNASVWESIHLLRHARTVHFKMYKIIVAINSRFGWFLMVFLLDMFCTLNISVFFVITSMIDVKYTGEIIRNVSLELFIFECAQASSCFLNFFWIFILGKLLETILYNLHTDLYI